MSKAFLFDTCVVEQYLHPRTEQKWPGMRAHVDRAVSEAGGMYISAVTAFEIRRHLEVLARTGQGRSKVLRTELFLRDAVLLELGDRGGTSWRVAARLYADGKLHRPAIQLSDGDLLIAATAIAHERVLATTDLPLYENLQALGYGEWVTSIALS
jgi:predicted nucleic acid-binding protein